MEFVDMISIPKSGRQIDLRSPEQLVQDFCCESLEEADTKLRREANHADPESVRPRKVDAMKSETEVSVFSSLHHCNKRNGLCFNL